MKGLFAIGLLLFAASLPPNALMLREMAIGASVSSRYRLALEPTGAQRHWRGFDARLGDARVRLADDAPPASDGEARFDGPVRITVNGREYGVDAPVRIRPAYTDANRYWGYVNLMELHDDEAASSFLVVAQNVGGGKYRLLWIDGSGKVVEDRFSYEERCSPPVRALIIRAVVPHPSGYCSDVMHVYPSLFYPILYPWVSGAGGAILALWTGAVLWGRRDRSIIAGARG